MVHVYVQINHLWGGKRSNFTYCSLQYAITEIQTLQWFYKMMHIIYIIAVHTVSSSSTATVVRLISLFSNCHNFFSYAESIHWYMWYPQIYVLPDTEKEWVVSVHRQLQGIKATWAWCQLEQVQSTNKELVHFFKICVARPMSPSRVQVILRFLILAWLLSHEANFVISPWHCRHQLHVPHEPWPGQTK